MDVIACADALDFPSFHVQGQNGNVVARRHLAVLLASLEDDHRYAQGFDQGRVIRGLDAFSPGMLMGFYEQVTAKDLRRLGSDQAAAVQRMEPAVVAAASSMQISFFMLLNN